MNKKVFTLFLALMVLLGGVVNAQKMADLIKDHSAPTVQNISTAYSTDLSKGEVTIGTGTLTSERYPIYAYFGYSYTQNLYLQSEIGSDPVFITHIRYYFAGTSLAVSNNWTIYMGNTTKSAFASTSDFIPVTEMTQVYSGTFTDPGAPGWIEFDITDFEYNGVDNLVIACDENAPDYDNSTDRFYCTTGYPVNRGLNWYSDTNNFDPAAPGTAGYCQPTIANIILVTVPTTGANITYTVTDGTNPLEGVALNFGADDYLTDVNGQVVKFLPEGDTDWTANLFGYGEETGTVTVVDGVDASVDVTMTALPGYFAYFTVEDVFANAIVDAAITIYFNGEIIYEGLTDALGEYSVELPAGAYTYDIVATDYASVIAGTLDVVDQDVYVDEVLTEVMTDPYGLLVDVIGNDAFFSWNNTLGLESFYDGFEDGTFDAWEEFIQGPGTPGDGDMAYWNPEASTTADEGLNSAHADWGYTIDTWLITPNIAITATTSLSFDFMTSYNWMVTNPNGDLIVKISTDDGLTWTDLWIEEDYGVFSDWTWYNVVLDLSAYDGEAAKIAFNLVADDNGDVDIDAIDISSAKRNFGIFQISSVPTVDSELKSLPEGISVEKIGFGASMFKAASSAYNNVSEVNNSAKVFESYTVYLDGVEEATGLTEVFYNFMDLASGDYVAGVQSIYTTGETAIIETPFTIPAGATITFIVDDGTVLLEGANVNINSVDYTTDVNGEAYMFLAPAEYNYTVSMFGYADVTGTLTVVDGVDADEPVSLTALDAFDVTFTVDNVLAELLEGAAITIYYGADVLETGTTDVAGEYTTNLPVGSYTYDVDFAGYVSVEGAALEVVDAAVAEDVTLIEDMAPVAGLEADVVLDDATITWFEPGHTFITPTWLHYDNTETPSSDNALGLTAGGDMWVAAYFPPADLAEFDGGVISKIRFFAGLDAGTATFTLKIWEGASITEVYSEVVTTYTADAWNEIDLTTPYIIDVTEDLYIGYSVVHVAGEYPAGMDAGPAVVGFGDKASLDNGTTWVNVSDYGFGNWSLRGYVDAPAGKGFLGTYNVYLDDVLQTTTPITDMTYTFTDLVNGTYTAAVTALYDTDESAEETVDFTINVIGIDGNVIEYSVYPNPSTGIYTVTVDTEYTVNVYDITGKLVSVSTINSTNNTIDLTSQNSGVYFIELTGENSLKFQVVKE